MRSMTGMGIGRAEGGGLSVQVELRSVNHRFLDVVFRMPSELSEHEPRLRERIGSAIARGRISINVDLDRGASGVELAIDENFVDAYVKNVRRLAKKHRLSDEVDLDRVLALPDAMHVRESVLSPKRTAALLDKAFDQALGRFQAMREKEGKALGQALAKRVKRLETERKRVEKHAASVPADLQRKLQERLKKLGAAEAVDPSRLAGEVAILADKASITEEIDRLSSHFAQFDDCLQSDEAVAKRMGFLLQEMHREVNTTGSKSTHLEITQAVMRMKEDLESLREQIANLE